MSHEDLTEEIKVGNLTVQQALGRIANERDGNTDNFQIPCEECGKLFLEQFAWSACLWLACPGHPTLASFQMKENTGIYPHQHFCCSKVCLLASITHCMTEHYLPERQNRYTQQKDIP